jgi:hypothetical protein
MARVGAAVSRVKARDLGAHARPLALIFWNGLMGFDSNAMINAK